MSEFQFVQWGKGIPNDYQRLNAMMINEQYLKDKIDPSPRGIIAWKKVAGTQYANPTGGYQDIVNLSDIQFDVEENRLISFEVQTGRLYSPSADIEVRFGIKIDGVQTINISGTKLFSGWHVSPVVYTFIPSSALSKGTHVVSAQFVSNNLASNLYIGEQSVCSMIIRDEGDFISQSS